MLLKEYINELHTWSLILINIQLQYIYNIIIHDFLKVTIITFTCTFRCTIIVCQVTNDYHVIIYLTLLFFKYINLYEHYDITIMIIYGRFTVAVWQNYLLMRWTILNMTTDISTRETCTFTKCSKVTKYEHIKFDINNILKYSQW